MWYVFIFMRLPLVILCAVFINHCFCIWVPLEFTNDTNLYYMYIGVGTPSQYFNAVPNLSTWSVQLPSKACDTCLRVFDATASSSFVPLVITESGIRGIDLLKAFNVPSLNQTFWQVAYDPETPPIDGFIGFGYGTNANTSQYPPWFVTVARYFKVKDFFSLNLDYKTLANAKLTIGEIDHAAFNGSIQVIPAVPNSNYWILNFTGISISDNTIALQCKRTKTCFSALSSTSEYIYGPESDISLILSQLNVSENCSNFSQLPAIQITIGNEIYPIPPEVYIKRLGNKCYPKLSPVTISGTINWIFGITFLQSVYTIYDVQGNTIGLSKSINQT